MRIIDSICLHFISQDEDYIDESELTGDWSYDQALEKFEENLFDDEPKRRIKDVFGSAAINPCLPRYLYIFTDYEEVIRNDESIFSLIQPEPDCSRMYEYFKKTGLSSYIKQVEGFSIPSEAILTSTHSYTTINEHLNDSLSE